MVVGERVVLGQLDLVIFIIGGPSALLSHVWLEYTNDVIGQVGIEPILLSVTKGTGHVW